MKDLLINSMMNNVSKYHDYDEKKLKRIKYGLSTLYINVTKLSTLFFIAYILGIIKTLLLLMASYNILRLFAYGVHAKKSIHCWISSLMIFLILPYICNYIQISKYLKLIISIICIILISIYAPADTEKRPLINKNKRIIFKIISIILSIIYSIVIYFTNNILLSNCMFFGLTLETIIILPITYKIFGVKYNNYKNYLKKGV